MVTIRQRGPAGEVFDVNAFLPDVAAFCRVAAWNVTVQACVGKGAPALEEQTAIPTIMSDAELRKAYHEIHQTIDGTFIGLLDGQQQCRLSAIDSSYWEVSGPPDFESHMLRKYGAYGG